MKMHKTVGLTTLAGSLLLMLAACGSGEEPVDATAKESSAAPVTTVTTTVQAAPETSVVAAAPEQSDAPDAACGPGDKQAALSEAVARLPLPFPDRDHVRWNLEYALNEYEPCANLSYAVVGIDNATVSSPYHILLFHRGQYLGTATAESYGFHPGVIRLDDSTIRVEYHYALPHESNAERSGLAIATFTWDDTQNKVVMTGEVPPDPE